MAAEAKAHPRSYVTEEQRLLVSRYRKLQKKYNANAAPAGS